MGKIFDMDSPVMRVLNRVGDLLILNVLMIVCCIPVITAGAAFTAMHYVLLKIVRGEEGYLIRGFFKSFRSNFRQATLIWLLMLLVVAVYVGDIWIFNYSGLVFPKPLIIAVAAVAFVLLMIAVYVFPLQARFENSVKNTLKNAMLLAFANLPRTILMMACYILPLVLGYFSTYALLFVIMLGISAPASDLEFSLRMDEEIKESDE